MWFRRTFIASGLVLALLVTLAPVSAARADGPKDVLQMVPDDAWGFVVLKSLNNLDDKAAQVKDVIGAQFPTPITPMALMMLNLGDKVDMTQPVCAVMMDAKKYGPGNPGDAMILLVPAKDAKALVDNLSATKETGEEKDASDDEAGDSAKDKGKEKGKGKATDSMHQPETKKPLKEGKGADDEKETAEGISKIQIMGQPAFAAVKGKYVIVGSNEECLTKVSKTKKTMAEGLAEARAAALDKNDLYISIAMSTVVNAYKDMFMPILQMATAATDPEGKNAKQLVKVLSEMSAVDLALTFDKSGLTFLMLLSPVKDSDMEKVWGDQKNSDKSLLARLPAEKYLLTMGTTGGYSQHNEKFSGENVVSQMVKSVGAKGLNEEALKTLDEELLKLAKAGGPTALCISLLPDGAEGMFGATVVAEVKDPKECVAGLRKIYKTAWSVAEGSDKEKKAEGDKGEGEEKPEAKKETKSPGKEEIAKVKENVVHAPDAETIDGNKIDTLTVKLEGLADALDIGEDEIGLVKKVVGKEMVVRFGAVEEKYLVLTFGGGKKRFETVCKHLKSPGEGLDKDASIKEASGRLPTPRVSEFYVAVDNVVQAVKDVATALGEGEEVPFEVPTVNAPVAISGAMKGPVQQINVVVPMKLIKAVKEAFEKMSASGGDFDEDEEADDEEGDGDAGAKPAAKTGAKADVNKDKGADKGKDRDKKKGEEKEDEEEED